MTNFIEKNAALLKFYSIAARIIGWVLICGGTIWFLLFALCILAARDAAGELRWPHETENVMYATSAAIFDFVFPGLIALVLAQLARRLVQDEYQPGRLLRFGDIILYAYAGLVICRAALTYYIWRVGLLGNYTAGHLLFVQPMVIPVIAKVLIIAGLAYVLRRVLPIIEEWKSLV
jgi:hypothetical protein